MKRAFAVVFGLLIAVTFAFWALMSAKPATKAHESLPELASKIGLTFPTEARLLGVDRQHGIDDYIAIKLAIPEDRLAVFIATLPFSEHDFRPVDQAILGANHGFWDPTSATLKRYVEGQLHDRALKIGIAAAKDGWVSVYVLSFET